MSPYDDPAVSAGEIANYLHSQRLIQSMDTTPQDLPPYGKNVLIRTLNTGDWDEACLESPLDGWPAYWQGTGLDTWGLEEVLAWQPLPDASSQPSEQENV